MDIPQPKTVDPQEREMQRLRARRDSSTWYAVMGIGMLFAGSFHVGFVVGGVLMVFFGILSYVYWSRRMKGVYDPWKDPELDAWEDEHFK